ncbi:solute carrier family 22 member 3 [Papilio machaon]|uniref:solute carrier family 22 member 3 n=1 Tax=Papilio machaon TaxID=76193 RepID=UPI001E664D7D|nr:solute carrier family 22 member 3 [Papilio machaon]
MAVISDMKENSLESVLVKLKIYKRYHLQVAFLLFISFAFNTIHNTNFIFVTEKVTYRCKHYIYNTTNICAEWEYDDPNSFVAEYNLANQEWKRTLVGSMHSLGIMAGLLIVGPLSDRFGRKKVLVVTGTLGGVFGVAKSFSPWYWFYCVLEFLEAAIGDCCSPCYILMTEIVSGNQRIIFTLMCILGHPFGTFMTALVAWLFPFWKIYLRILYAPCLLYVLYIFFLDESPRWLLIKKKKAKAASILEKAVRRNNLLVEKNVLENIACEDCVKTDFLNVLKTTFQSKLLRKRFFVCLVWWTTSTFVNYGMSINAVTLYGNKYVNFALLGIVEALGMFMMTFIMIRFRRKYPLMSCFFAAAILCISQPFVPKNLSWLSILLYMIGKLMTSLYFGITYLYTSELYPTLTRNSMHALCSSLGRIGAIIAPQTPLLMEYWSGFPPLIFGLVSTFAGLLTITVPDISNQALPDTVRQAEELGVPDVQMSPHITKDNNKASLTQM